MQIRNRRKKTVTLEGSVKKTQAGYNKILDVIV